MAIDDGSLGDWGPSPMTEKESILSNRVRELEKIVSIMRPADVAAVTRGWFGADDAGELSNFSF